MYVKLTYHPEFVELLYFIKSKYGEHILELEGIGNSNLDLPEFAKRFFSVSDNNKSVSDKSIDSNANIADNPSVINFAVEATKPFFKLNSLYKLWKECKKLYGRKIADDLIVSSIVGDTYLNDSVNILFPYCYNYSTLDVANKGLPTVNKIKSTVPKHLFSFMGQLSNFIILTSNSTLGASGISDFLLTTSIYFDRILKTKKDSSFSFSSEEDCWNYLKENIISFIFIVNQNFRSNQSAFTNVSIYDDIFLKEMLDSYKLVIDSELYEAKIDVVKKIQEIYIDSFNEILRSTPCTFPVTTSCTAIDDDGNVIDTNFLKMIAEKNSEFGFINIYSGASSTLSSCCRLRSDKNNDYFNSIGGTSSKIGSLGVCTLNLPRLAFKYVGNEKEFFSSLKDLVWKAQRVNNAKRHILKKRIDQGNLPLYTQEYMLLDTQYCTVGVNGIYECVTEMGYDILSQEGVDFQLKIINTINHENDIISKQYKMPVNCEQIPGESVSIKLAKKDELLGYNKKYELYSNQFIPLTSDANMFDRIRLQGIYDKHFSGGSILHLNVNEKIKDSTDLYNLMLTAISQGVVYFAINYVLLSCEQGHMTVGGNDSEKCNICNSNIVDKYTRIVGFLTNTKNWHHIRRNKDFPNRKFYNNVT